MDEVRVFPHDNRSAQKTARAGVVTCNDLISEDSYHIMTRETGADAAVHTTSMYSLDEDTSSLVESARSETAVAGGEAISTLSLLRTIDGVRSMHEVLACRALDTTISARDAAGGTSTARFDADGLRWDEATSSVYIGGDIFRIRYSTAAETGDGTATLAFQARHPVTGGYVTKLSISND